MAANRYIYRFIGKKTMKGGKKEGPLLMKDGPRS